MIIKRDMECIEQSNQENINKTFYSQCNPSDLKEIPSDKNTFSTTPQTDDQNNQTSSPSNIIIENSTNVTNIIIQKGNDTTEFTNSNANSSINRNLNMEKNNTSNPQIINQNECQNKNIKENNFNNNEDQKELTNNTINNNNSNTQNIFELLDKKSNFSKKSEMSISNKSQIEEYYNSKSGSHISICYKSENGSNKNNESRANDSGEEIIIPNDSSSNPSSDN